MKIKTVFPSRAGLTWYHYCEGKRRMTLHGPGTAGYIAPDTRGPIYDYQADMWAYLVWAASMCLRVEFIVDCQLEEALADLALEKKIAPTAGHEDKVDAVLRAFEEAGKVEDGCEGIFELVRSSAPWVDSTLRWTPEEAREEMEAFRGDHGLVIDVSAVQQRRKSVAGRTGEPRTRLKNCRLFCFASLFFLITAAEPTCRVTMI